MRECSSLPCTAQVKFARSHAFTVLASIPPIVEPMEKTLKTKPKSSATKNEVEQNEDMIRGTLRAIEKLLRIDGAETCAVRLCHIMSLPSALYIDPSLRVHTYCSRCKISSGRCASQKVSKPSGMRLLQSQRSLEKRSGVVLCTRAFARPSPSWPVRIELFTFACQLQPCSFATAWLFLVYRFCHFLRRNVSLSLLRQGLGRSPPLPSTPSRATRVASIRPAKVLSNLTCG